MHVRFPGRLIPQGAKSAKLEGFFPCLTDENVEGPIPVVETSSLGLPNHVSRSFLQCDQLTIVSFSSTNIMLTHYKTNQFILVTGMMYWVNPYKCEPSVQVSFLLANVLYLTYHIQKVH